MMALKQSHNEGLVQFVAKLKSVAGDALESVILYGSGAGEDFHDHFSDLNVLVVLRSAEAQSLERVAPAIEWWRQQGMPAPVVLSEEELRHSADVFAIELIDMKERHRLLYGSDLLRSIDVPRDLHRVQVERELRTSLVKLRQAFFDAKGDEALSRLMTASVSTFGTLFRHALMVFGQPAPMAKRAAVEEIGRFLSLDVTGVLHVLDIREKRAPADKCSETFAAYLAAVTRVTNEVDKRLG
jgi:hypothetical protein